MIRDGNTRDYDVGNTFLRYNIHFDKTLPITQRRKDLNEKNLQRPYRKK